MTGEATPVLRAYSKCMTHRQRATVVFNSVGSHLDDASEHVAGETDLLSMSLLDLSSPPADESNEVSPDHGTGSLVGGTDCEPASSEVDSVGAVRLEAEPLACSSSSQSILSERDVECSHNCFAYSKVPGHQAQFVRVVAIPPDSSKSWDCKRPPVCPKHFESNGLLPFSKVAPCVANVGSGLMPKFGSVLDVGKRNVCDVLVGESAALMVPFASRGLLPLPPPPPPQRRDTVASEVPSRSTGDVIGAGETAHAATEHQLENSIEAESEKDKKDSLNKERTNVFISPRALDRVWIVAGVRRVGCTASRSSGRSVTRCDRFCRRASFKRKRCDGDSGDLPLRAGFATIDHQVPCRRRLFHRRTRDVVGCSDVDLADACPSFQEGDCSGASSAPLLGDMVCTPGLQWTYPLRDEQNRCFVGHLKSAFSEAACGVLFERIRQGTHWLQPENSLGPVARYTSWMATGGCNCPYRYGGLQVAAQEFPQWMRELVRGIMPMCGLTSPSEWPNSCNLNLYEDGGMSVGWHADDEPLFQGKFQDCRIISLSLGVTRRFELRSKKAAKGETYLRRIDLGPGDVLTMEGMTQRYYKHRVPREESVGGPRVNLTWRWVVKHATGCAAASK
eukprot:TRINITY_DN43102_c0_g1_i1.p1 TRINITY_DN43102_c0_g1~~TRINITY_DN43102_c0_g1_i1.p1  ORF type:complete len:660 (+),score=86.82 TRINITY_DN43102_c0_g1_i1:125-1981(+)